MDESRTGVGKQQDGDDPRTSYYARKQVSALRIIDTCQKDTSNLTELSLEHLNKSYSNRLSLTQ